MSRRLVLRDLGTYLAGIALAVGIALALAVLLLKPSPGDAQALALCLGGTGLAALLIGPPLIWGIVRWPFRSLRARIVAACSLSVALALLILLLISSLMFLSPHDAQLLFLLLVFVGLVSGCVAWLVARALSASVERLTLATGRVMAGDLTARVEVPGSDELARLGASFNEMAARLEAAALQHQQDEAARRELIAAVSHDLRTPLASIRVMVEALNDGLVDDPETVQRYLGTIQGQVSTLSVLIDDLFELAQLSSGQLHLPLQEASLCALVSDAIEGLRPQAEQKQLQLRGEIDDSLEPLWVDPSKLQRALLNLLQNAIRHTPADGTIVVAVRREGELVRVDVQDSGEGIAAEDLPHVFDRFYRGEKSRSREYGGAGLGLAIAKGIVEAHGGRIWVESHPPDGPRRGSTFSFTLPRRQEVGAAS